MTLWGRGCERVGVLHSLQHVQTVLTQKWSLFCALFTPRCNGLCFKCSQCLYTTKYHVWVGRGGGGRGGAAGCPIPYLQCLFMGCQLTNCCHCITVVLLQGEAC